MTSSQRGAGVGHRFAGFEVRRELGTVSVVGFCAEFGGREFGSLARGFGLSQGV